MERHDEFTKAYLECSVARPRDTSARENAYISLGLLARLVNANALQSAPAPVAAPVAKRPHAWTCGHCGKRVGAQYDVCECGDTRAWGR